MRRRAAIYQRRTGMSTRGRADQSQSVFARFRQSITRATRMAAPIPSSSPSKPPSSSPAAAAFPHAAPSTAVTIGSTKRPIGARSKCETLGSGSASPGWLNSGESEAVAVGFGWQPAQPGQPARAGSACLCRGSGESSFNGCIGVLLYWSEYTRVLSSLVTGTSRISSVST